MGAAVPKVVLVFWAFIAITLLGNGVGYVLIGRDKKAAKKGSRRRPEDTFSLLALVGWWPGMVVAMRVHRHKTRKTSFKVQLAFTAIIGTVIWLIVAAGLWEYAP